MTMAAGRAMARQSAQLNGALPLFIGSSAAAYPPRMPIAAKAREDDQRP